MTCVQNFAKLWTVAHQAPLSIEFSRQEYRRGLPFPTPGDFPNPGIKVAYLESPTLTGRFFNTPPPGKPCPCSELLILSCHARDPGPEDP